MRGLLRAQNERLFRKLEGSRRSWFEPLDRPAVGPSPAQRYQFATYKHAKINIDYHIEVHRNYYSVPYSLVHQTVEVRITGGTIEALHRGRRVASHRRLKRRGFFSTDDAHMPMDHQKWARRTPARLIDQAAAVGPQDR